MNIGAIALYAVFLVLMLVWVVALIEAGMTPHVAYARANANKGMIMLLLVITGWFGALYWFGVMRRRVRH